MNLNSITLLSFALGIVLILAATIGKEIKIAAIELPAISEKLPRLVLAIIGAALIYFGIFDPFQLNPKESEPTAVPTVVANTPTSAPVPTALENAASEFNGNYLLQTQFLEAQNKCLEGNNVGGEMGGAAFMNDCTNPATGQLWNAVPVSDGYYLLQTQFSKTENKCLEGNNVGGEMGGAAFMSDCANPATGQLWKLVPASNGYYLLQTRLVEAENKCLEGNNIGGEIAGGAAFMNDCTNPSTGQLWKLAPAP